MGLFLAARTIGPRSQRDVSHGDSDARARALPGAAAQEDERRARRPHHRPQRRGSPPLRTRPRLDEEAPGLNLISHGPDRNLSEDEIGGIQLVEDVAAAEA